MIPTTFMKVLPENNSAGARRERFRSQNIMTIPPGPSATDVDMEKPLYHGHYSISMLQLHMAKNEKV